MADQKKADSSKPYVSAEYTFPDPCACPRCGAEMRPVPYFIGDVLSGGTTTYSTSFEKVTTTTINYSKVSQKTGAVCPKCFARAKRGNAIFFLVIAVIALLVGLLIIRLLYPEVEGQIRKVPGAMYVLIAIVPLICLYGSWANLSMALKVGKGKYNQEIDDTFSNDLVSTLKDKKLISLENRQHILSAKTVREMQEQSQNRRGK